MKALVVGYGSIGARHARILGELGCSTAVVSKHASVPRVFEGIDEALAKHQPGYIVIANATGEHHGALARLATLGYRGAVLVEKPLFDHVRPVPPHAFAQASVAYNLRFHPLVLRLKVLLEGERILSVQAYAGQYLPDWRPDTDYRESYSASAQRGGGVLRDLSHELDYLGWMLGGWSSVAALGGRTGSLEITSDDVFCLLMKTERCPVVSVQVNYLDRRARRNVVVNTAGHTFEIDLVKGTLQVDRQTESFEVERDATYRAMHVALLRADTGIACTLDEALDTLRLVAAAERSAQDTSFVMR